jgi:thiamine pyrophosphokinase
VASTPSLAQLALLDVIVLGALGGSVTHEFAALNTLMRFRDARLQLSLVSDHNVA